MGLGSGLLLSRPGQRQCMGSVPAAAPPASGAAWWWLCCLALLCLQAGPELDSWHDFGKKGKLSKTWQGSQHAFQTLSGSPESPAPVRGLLLWYPPSRASRHLALPCVVEWKLPVGGVFFFTRKVCFGEPQCLSKVAFRLTFPFLVAAKVNPDVL